MKISLSRTDYTQTPAWLQSDHTIHVRGGVTIDRDLVAPDENGKRIVRAGTVIGYHAGFDRWGPYVPDSLVTGTVASNNAIRWTSKKPGRTLRVEIVSGAALAVAIVGDTVQVAVTGSTTAAQVIAAVNAHLVASEIVSAANEGVSTGAGVVQAVAATALTGSNGIVPSAILTEDVDVTAEDIAAGALLHGVVVEARLPQTVDPGAKAALRQIIFV